jgi:hypothetical protein
LFQNDNFKTDKGNVLEYPEGIYPTMPNIMVKNIELSFGAEVSNVGDNVLEIYSPDSLEYAYENYNDSTNLKKIGLLWYNKDNFDKYLGFSDGLYDPDYKEEIYLKVSKKDSRLVN